MDKETLHLFQNKKILLKKLQKLDVSEFSKTRSLKIYFGVNTKDFFHIVFIRDAKSRLLLKDVDKLNEILKNYEIKFDTSIKIKTLFLKSQICSKAKIKLMDNGWKIYDFM